MPVGYLIGVLVVAIPTLFALAPLRSPPNLSFRNLLEVIAWVRAHGPGYGADPALLFVSGSSAGAHMAALAALTPNDPAFQPGFLGAIARRPLRSRSLGSTPGTGCGTLADLSDRRLDAAGPRIAMAGEHELGGEVLQTGQGFHRLGGIGGEGRHLRAAGTSCDRVGRQRIADE